jgi:hypothetical protein
MNHLIKRSGPRAGTLAEICSGTPQSLEQTDYGEHLPPRRVDNGIRGAESVVYEESAHLAQAEESDCYREVLESFVTRVEAARAEAR